jgi:aspartyl-tRNA(Asn)/glutamyl-tRNA(Gln) amidotransferase subunit B
MIQTRSTDSPTTLARDMDLLHDPRPESSSPSHLRALCEAAISELPDESAVVRKTGSDAPVLNKLVGAVMRKSRGKVDATAVKMMLIEVLLRSG